MTFLMPTKKSVKATELQSSGIMHEKKKCVRIWNVKNTQIVPHSQIDSLLLLLLLLPSFTKFIGPGTFHKPGENTTLCGYCCGKVCCAGNRVTTSLRTL